MPVAFKVGYIHEYDEGINRQQVIVVLLEDWTVLCYNSNLEILWEKEIGHFSHDMEHMRQYFRIAEASIQIAPFNLFVEEEGKDETCGTVIVGASMELREELLRDDISRTIFLGLVTGC